MTTRQGPGGVIPADGRPTKAKGVGKNAKRHDLEGPATPGLGGDLQYGEVGDAEAAARTIGKKVQRPASGQTEAPRSQPAPAGGGAMQTPDPGEFIRGRLKNTLQGGVSPTPQAEPIDPTPWLPLIEKIATAPNAGGILGAAYVEALSRATMNQPRVYTLDMNELDKRVDQLAR